MNTKYKDLLKQYVSFKSISADKAYLPEIEKTVNWLKELFVSLVFDVQIIEGYDNPMIVADYIIDPSFETALVYGHYDVQPAEKSDGWSSEPFDLTEIDDKLIGRGSMDNKGQFLMHFVAITELLEKKELKYNIKFLLEGNEETGSPSIQKFISENISKLKCSFIVLSDGKIIGSNPAIELGTRGLVNLELTYKTSHTDLHSGVYGSSAPNAIHELSKFISTLYDAGGRINISNFYDDVDPIDDDTKTMLSDVPFDLDKHLKISGTKTMLNEPKNNFYIQTGLRPSIQVTGIYGGYISEGVKTIIPASATAKINIRIVKNQKVDKVIDLFTKHVEDNTPDFVDFEIKNAEGVEATKVDLNNRYVLSAKEKLEKSFGQKVVNYYVGGTLPIIKAFQDILKVPVVLVPLGNEDSNMHGIDENLSKMVVNSGIEFSKRFFSKL